MGAVCRSGVCGSGEESIDIYSWVSGRADHDDLDCVESGGGNQFDHTTSGPVFTAAYSPTVRLGPAGAGADEEAVDVEPWMTGGTYHHDLDDVCSVVG